MSGFVGQYRLDDQPVDKSGLEKMTVSLAHRGMDASGLWSTGSIGLGHRMGWTTPESLREYLPFHDAARELAISADARLDNRSELLRALELDDCAIPDSALILLAYDRWEESCPERLLGDFAFVIWDGRRRRLFCARDHFGVKPFFYHHQADRLFACASEIKALLCLQEIPRRLNEQRVADYLLTELDDKTITFHKDILRLPPGHRMIVDRHRISVEAFWALDPERTIRFKRDEEYAENLRELFTDAVRVRMRSAFPAGTLLSGGLDSSSITCVARMLNEEGQVGPLPTFSAVFDNMPCDERSFIQAVVDHGMPGQIHAHFVQADQLSPMTDFEAMFWHQDEPFFAPNLYMHWGLYGLAAKRGVRVLLDGLEGDVTISHGEDRLTELTRSLQWGTLAREINAIAHQPGTHWVKAVRSFVLSAVIPQPARRLARVLRGSCNGAAGMLSLLRPEFSRRSGVKDRIRAMRAIQGDRTHANKGEHFRRLTHGVIPLLHEVADLAASAFRIEPRYPFADRRLAEYCLAVPPSQKRAQGWDRVILRRAMAGMLPETIRWRKGKSDLSPNFAKQLLARDWSLLDEIILRFPDVISPYVQVGPLQQKYQHYRTSPNALDALTLWKAVSLGLWLRRSAVQV